MRLFSAFMDFVRQTRGIDAEARSARLLLANLSPAQRQQFTKHKHFDVVGGQTGTSYRIRRGPSVNVDELDAAGNAVAGLCFYPKGYLRKGDVMLAQKFALELDEAEVLAIAHRYSNGSRVRLEPPSRWQSSIPTR
jgi:hypothetical protein